MKKYGLYFEPLNCGKRATVIVDKNGKVAYVKVQEIKVARDDKDILAALAETELTEGQEAEGTPQPSGLSSPLRSMMSGIVEDVSDANYKEFTDSSGAVVAYGLATCEPCKTYDPILEDTAAKFPEIKVGKAKMHVPGRCREIKKTHSLRDLSHHAFLRKRQAAAHPRRGSRQGRTRGADFRLPPQVKQKLRTSTPSTLCCVSYCRKSIFSAVKRSGTNGRGKTL